MQIKIRDNASEIYWNSVFAMGLSPGSNEIKFRNKLKLIDGKTVDVETEHLFEDQYNIEGGTNGLRIMGKYVEYVIDDIRQTIGKCPYCGNQTPNKIEGFCEACTDSPYLTTEHLFDGFTRIRALIGDKPNRDKLIPLTDAEKAKLLPVYIKRQTTGRDSRNAEALRKKRKSLRDDCAKTIYLARMERDGMLWFMYNNVSIKNCIFYNHTETFSFGWREKLSNEVASKLREQTTGFPYKIEFKTV